MSSITKSVMIAIYTILAVVFSIYFVLLDSNMFILYTFPLFLAFSFLISYKKRMYSYVMWTSIGLAVAGTLAYANSIMPVLAINVSIIGFYLLISVAVSAMLSRIDSKAFRRFFGWATVIIENRYGYVVAAAIVLGLMLLVMPIWPAGMTVNGQSIAYVPVNPGQKISSGYSILYLNASKYAGYIDNNATNVGFGYPNGSLVKAYVPDNVSFRDSSIPVVINTDSPNTLLRMYFMPMSSGYNGVVKQVNSSVMQELQPKPVSTDFGNVVGGDFANSILPYTMYINSSSTLKQNIVVGPYYFVDPICGQGKNTVASVEYTANNSISAFLVDNSTVLDNVVVTAKSSDQVTYDFLMSKLKGVASVMNIASGSGQFTNISIKNNCSYIAIVAPRETTLSIKVVYNYSKLTYNMRNIYLYKNSPIVVRYAFLPESMSTMISKYQKYVGSG